MKKVLKIIVLILLAFLLCLAALFFYLSKRPAAPANYQSKVQTGGKIEEKYMSNEYVRKAYENFGSEIIRIEKE